jgi:microcystin degradation protein MlrC
MKYLGIKSTGHFRSGFESIAGSIFNVECNGLFSQDFSKLPYKNLGRPVYPLDKNIKFLSSD